MKYCSKCGKQIADDAVFCSACGTEQKPTVANVASQKPTSENVQIIPPRDPKSEAIIKRRPALGILMILAAVAIILLTIVFIASRL